MGSADDRDAAREVVERWVRRQVVNKLAALLSMLGRTGMDHRASGLCRCDYCGADYRNHATCPREPWITMLCDGTRVKL